MYKQRLRLIAWQAPRRFATSTPKKGVDVASFSFQTSSRELTSETKHNEQRADFWEESKEDYTDSHTIPCYSLDVKSALTEVAR